jgi:flagellar hook assembly protein FlgD
MMGQEVHILANTTYEAGRHIVRWDGTDMSGNKAPTGIYFYRIQAGDKVISDRILLTR